MKLVVYEDEKKRLVVEKFRDNPYQFYLDVRSSDSFNNECWVQDKNFHVNEVHSIVYSSFADKLFAENKSKTNKTTNDETNYSVNQKIGSRLRKLRLDRGLSMRISYLIRRDYDIKLTPSYLSRIERGTVDVPLRTLFALADFYKTSVSKILDSLMVNGYGQRQSQNS